MTYSVVIVDDEPPARAKLNRFMADLSDFRTVGEADSVETAIQAIAGTSPDVLFLDIQLGTRSGFDILDGLRGTAASPLVVFTTAYSEHAVKAFEVQALDYLLKPFDNDRFLASIARVRTALGEPDRSDFEERVRRMLASVPGRPAPLKQILVRDSERAFFLAVDDIQRVAAAGNYVEVFARGKSHLIREPLTGFAAQLDPTEFLRVHRSHVVRVSFIAELRPMFHGDYELVLRDGQRLALSRRYKQLLPESIRGRL
ncbi:MAG TPA: LytTR family DNA-binding domain-containing protein [Steroidobacteraceae bacterium]|jgi:two-component system LytT family response regulator